MSFSIRALDVTLVAESGEAPLLHELPHVVRDRFRRRTGRALRPERGLVARPVMLMRAPGASVAARLVEYSRHGRFALDCPGDWYSDALEDAINDSVRPHYARLVYSRRRQRPLPPYCDLEPWTCWHCGITGGEGVTSASVALAERGLKHCLVCWASLAPTGARAA